MDGELNDMDASRAIFDKLDDSLAERTPDMELCEKILQAQSLWADLVKFKNLAHNVTSEAVTESLFGGAQYNFMVVVPGASLDVYVPGEPEPIAVESFRANQITRMDEDGAEFHNSDNSETCRVPNLYFEVMPVVDLSNAPPTP